MGDPQEVGLKVEDWMGVNRQQTQEQIQDNSFWTLQNLYERKIGELQRRGGSQLMTNTSLPTNVSSIESDYILYDKVLGKTKILKVGCTVPGVALTEANVSASFVTSPAGHWGASPVGFTNAFCGASNVTSGGGVFLVGVGFGLQALINSPITASLPASGDTKTFQVVISAGGVSNKNLRSIELYAQVIGAYASSVAVPNYIWIGTIDLVATPSGTFNFPFAPITLGADPGTGDVGSTDTTWTLAPSATTGNFVLGKTYYVAVLNHRVHYDSSNVLNKNYYVAQSIQSVTMTAGMTSIVISKTAGGSAANIIAIGLHPNSLRPLQMAPNTTTWTATISSVPTSCMSGVVNFIPTSPDVNTGYWIFNQTDISVDEMFATIDSNNNWLPIYINNFGGLNTDTLPGRPPQFTISSTASGFGVSTGARWSGSQYFSQTQELMFLCPKNNYNIGTGPLNGNLGIQVGFTGDLSSGTNTILNVSPIPTVQQFNSGSTITGPGIPLGTTATISGTTMTMSNNSTLTATASDFCINANHSNSINGPAHNIVQYDGWCATMAVMDFNSQSPPYFSILGVYQEHLLGAGGSGIARNKLFFANPFDPFNWIVAASPTVVQYIQIESSGEDINCLGTYVNSANLTGPIEQIIVGKRSSLWVLTTLPTYTSSSNNNVLLTELSRKAGAANDRCIVSTEMGTIIAGVDNVWLIRGTGEPTPIGDEIKWFLRGEDPTQIVDPTNWSAVYHDNHYKLAFSAPGSSTPNQELWLNINKMKKMKGQPCWYGPMIGRECWAQTVEIQFNDTIIPKRWSVDQTNLRWYWADREDFSQDFGVNLSFLLDTKNFGGQDDTLNKLYKGSMWKMKADQALTFLESLSTINETGTIMDANSRLVPILPGYTASNYANFVANCRAKLYRYFTINRGMFGENLNIQWSYTGPIYFTIAGFVAYYSTSKRRPGLPGG